MNDSLKDILQGKRPLDTDFPAAKPLKTEGEEIQEDVGPCGLVMPKGCLALDVERGGKEPVVSFQFVYLGVKSEFRPDEFWVMFVGMEHWKVTVKGRNLRRLFDRLQDHCLRRIRQADRDFGGNDGKPFITKIEVQDVTPKERE